jgi:hypothetical protein
MAFGADSEEKWLSKERKQESNVIYCPNNRFDHLTQCSFVHFCRVVLHIRSVHREANTFCEIPTEALAFV